MRGGLALISEGSKWSRPGAAFQGGPHDAAVGSDGHRRHPPRVQRPKGHNAAPIDLSVVPCICKATRASCVLSRLRRLFFSPHFPKHPDSFCGGGGSATVVKYNTRFGVMYKAFQTVFK